MKKPLKITLWVVGAIVLLSVLVNVCSGPSSDGKATNDGMAATEGSASAKEAKAKSAWSYHEQTNEMDDSTIYYASVNADDQLEFDFPYNGGVTASIALLNRGGRNLAMLRISKGQFISSMLGGQITVRFDSLPARKFNYSDPDDHSSETIFINEATKFINGLKNSQKTIVQCTFFNEGLRTMKFDTKDLKWEH